MKIPVHNNTAMPIYVHGQMIAAGETRHFDEADVPAEYRPRPVEPAPEAAPDPLAVLLAKPVKAIEAQFKDLATEQLEQLNAMERKANAPRKSLLAAIDEELINRAIAEEEAGKARG